MNASLPPLSRASRIIGADAPQLIKGGVFLTRVLVERLVDDLDDAPETVDFSYRGVDYQIDLSARNVRALDKLLAPYLDVSRRRERPRAATRPAAKAPKGTSMAKEVRAWARSEGIAVSDRGRVPAELVKRYRDAHGG
jgi:hypothetical protein